MALGVAPVRRVLGLIAALAFLSIASGRLNADEPAKYAFKIPPLEIYDRLKEINAGELPEIAKQERVLLESQWRNQAEGKAREISDDDLRDALIYASGVVKEDEVKALREAYGKLLTETSAKLKELQTPTDRAEKLLTHLHASAMKGGYKLEKTTLAEIFEEQKFNCVSSTALYCLLGKAQGLKLQPISVPGSDFTPGHATVDLLVDGKRIQIEPTNANGYDWDTKLKQPGVISLNFGPKRETGHDVSLWNLPAMMYSNRGNRYKKPDASDQLMMMRCYTAALALACDDECATKNMRAALVNWGPGLIEGKKYAEAVKAMEFAKLVAPDDDGVETNRRLVWSKQIMWLLENQDDAEAMAAAEKARAALPDDSSFESRVSWFENLGHAIYKKSGFEESLAIVARGEKVLSPEEMKKLMAWRTGQIRLWSQSLLEEKKYAESLAVLKRFYDSDSPDEKLDGGIAYHTSRALPLAYAKGGVAEAVTHYAALREAFPKCDDVKKAAVGFAHLTVEPIWKKQEFDKAGILIGEFLPLVDAPEERVSLHERHFFAWIDNLAKAKKWEDGLAKALDAIKAVPESSHLKSRGAGLINEWAMISINAKAWDEAIKIYERGLKHFPDDSTLKNNLEYCREQKAK